MILTEPAAPTAPECACLYEPAEDGQPPRRIEKTVNASGGTVVLVCPLHNPQPPLRALSQKWRVSAQRILASGHPQAQALASIALDNAAGLERALVLTADDVQRLAVAIAPDRYSDEMSEQWDSYLGKALEIVRSFGFEVAEAAKA
jgi:hypothetical protein